MITIQGFAKLCGCNTQTLRYYDRIGLLKPERVDEWTGYRYYEEEQALQFVKIKNLQQADFSIEEINVNDVLYRLSHATMLSYFRPTSPVGHLEQFVLPTEPTDHAFSRTKVMLPCFLFSVKGFLSAFLSVFYPPAQGAA